MTTTLTKVLIVGCGAMAREHIKRILPNFKNTVIPIICEPSNEAYLETIKIFKKNNRPEPINEPDLKKALIKYANKLDVAFIITPHSMHYSQAKMCMEAGLDILIEKPMVMNPKEAIELIKTRDHTKKLAAVAFQGSMSPQIRTAMQLLESGKLGRITNISGIVWQNWAKSQAGQWRSNPEISGGGFLFDTGAHLLNTVANLAGEDFTRISAILHKGEYKVEISGVIMAQLKSGILVTLNGCGESIISCAADIRVFCTKAILRTDSWGKFLDIQWHRETGWEKVNVPESSGVWEEFLSVREGKIANPSPLELGLRTAKMWENIKKSAANNGNPIEIKDN